MTIDFKNLGAPQWVATFITGVIVGAMAATWIVTNIYEKGITPSLEQELKINANKLQECTEKLSVQSQTVKQCFNAEDVSSLQKQVKQLSQWNTDWKDEYDKLTVDRNKWRYQANILSLIEDAQKKRDSISRDILNLTSGNCGEDRAGCDLIPIAQRKLRAYEQDRANSQAQIMDLQSKLCK